MDAELVLIRLSDAPVDSAAPYEPLLRKFVL